jgi:hypothetical protein
MPQLRWSLERITVALIVAALLLGGMIAPGQAALAQDGAESPFPQEVLATGAIDISILATGMVELDPSTGTHLTLERVTIQPDTVFGPFTSMSPTLIAAETGAFLTEDERGFMAHVRAPFQTVLPSASTVTWTVSDVTTFFRLSLADAPTSPAEGVEVHAIASLKVDELPAGAAQLFLATAAVGTDAGSVRIDHLGPVGLSVQTGSMDLLSPSGLEGTLETGSSMFFPNSMALDILGTNGADATALIFGVVDAAANPAIQASLFNHDCRNPNVECTPPGTSLGNGESWHTPTASLTLRGSTNTDSNVWIAGRELKLEFTYTNRSQEHVAFVVSPASFRVTDDQGTSWSLSGGYERTFELDPGESDLMTIRLKPPTNGGVGTTLIEVAEFGDIEAAQWQGQVEASQATTPGLPLAFGETWGTSTADLNVHARKSTDATELNGSLTVDMTYTNTGIEPVAFSVNPASIVVEFVIGGRLTGETNRSVDIALDPGESITVSLRFRAQPGRTEGDITVRVSRFGDIEDAQWSGPIG